MMSFLYFGHCAAEGHVVLANLGMGERSHRMYAIVRSVPFNRCSNVHLEDTVVMWINFLSQQPKDDLTSLRTHCPFTDERQQFGSSITENLMASVASLRSHARIQQLPCHLKTTAHRNLDASKLACTSLGSTGPIETIVPEKTTASPSLIATQNHESSVGWMCLKTFAFLAITSVLEFACHLLVEGGAPVLSYLRLPCSTIPPLVPKFKLVPNQWIIILRGMTKGTVWWAGGRVPLR